MVAIQVSLLETYFYEHIETEIYFKISIFKACVQTEKYLEITQCKVRTKQLGEL